jgi:transcriptional regulator with XRE-family HTH domain
MEIRTEPIHMETIGQKLKTAREKSGLSPSEVAKAIRIKTEYVAAIEKDEFHKLIAPVYARGFIKLYARCVQLDPAPLMRQFGALENTAVEPVKPEVPRRKETVERKKRAPLKISFPAFTEAWKRIKRVDFSRLRPPALPALELPDKKWILLAAAVAVSVAVCLAVLPGILKQAAAVTPRIKVPPAARFLAEPPEPYLDLQTVKMQPGR